MSRRSKLVALFVVAGIVIWWLGSDTAQPPPQPQTEKPRAAPRLTSRRVLASAPERQPSVKQSLPEITLIDPGDEPREQLRLQIKPGLRQELVLDLELVVATALAQQVAPRVRMPTMRIHALLEVTGVTEEGHAHAEFTIRYVRLLEAPGVMPGLAKALHDGVAQIEGFRGYLVVDARGRTHEAEFDAADELPEEVRQLIDGLRVAMDQLTLPLPEEPVGPGASWAVMVQRNPLGVVVFDQAVTYSLVEHNDEGLTLGFDIVQTADSQLVNIPDLPDGARVKLSSYAAEGKGRSVLALDQVLPRKNHLEMSSELQMTVSLGSLREPAAVFTDIKLAILEP